jgi:hypothetical protein
MIASLRLALLGALALGACAPGPAPEAPPGPPPPEGGQVIATPGMDGADEGDPLGGPDLDPTFDPI